MASVRTAALPFVEGVPEGDLISGDIGGYVARIMADRVEGVRPRFSPAEYQAMTRSMLPPDDEQLKVLLKGFPLPWANAFYRHNKIVHTEDGASDLVPRIPIKQVEAILGQPTAGEQQARESLDQLRGQQRLRRDAEAAKPKVPVYNLQAIMSDLAVMARLGMTQAEVAMVGRLAINDPVQACKYAVHVAKNRGHAVEVRPGEYAKGRKAARARVLAAAEHAPLSQFDLMVVGGDLLVQSDTRDVQTGQPEWTLKAASWQAPELIALHRIAMARGPTVVGSLFTLDMITLGVEFEAGGHDYGINFEAHCGTLSPMAGAWGLDPSVYSEHVAQWANRVLPVRSDGQVCATAVRHSTSEVFVNWHVLQALRVSNPGSEITVSCENYRDCRVRLHSEAAHDVWNAEVEVPDVFAGSLQDIDPMVFRNPEEGERAVMMYATPLGVRCTDAFVVERVEHDSVIAPRQPEATAGVSGGLMVAVDDGVPLAMYTGSNVKWSVFSLFGTTKQLSAGHIADAAAMAETTVFPMPAQAVQVHTDMKARGLDRQVREVAQAVQPLYSQGRHVGSCFRSGSWCHTALDPTLWHLAYADGRSALMGPSGAGGSARLAEPAPVVRAREATIGENVVVVAKTTEGQVVMSHNLLIVGVSDDGRKLRFGGSPDDDLCKFEGGAIMAVADASVLGLYAETRQADIGPVGVGYAWVEFTALCLTPSPVHKLRQMRETIRAAKPAMGVMAWSGEDLAAVCSPHGDKAHGFSQLGGVALKTVLGMRSLENGVATAGTRPLSVHVDDDLWFETVAEAYYGHLRSSFGSRSALVASVLTFFGVVVAREGLSTLREMLDELPPPGPIVEPGGMHSVRATSV